MCKKIGKYLTYKEVIKSSTAIRKGIKNIPDKKQLYHIKLWYNHIFKPVREFINNSLGCNSIFRCIELNEVIGGSNTSQHCALKGAAGDIDCDKYHHGTNKDIFNFIRCTLDFDQLIWEFGTKNKPDWVHVSYNKGHNRHQILVSYKDKNNKTKYKNYATI